MVHNVNHQQNEKVQKEKLVSYVFMENSLVIFLNGIMTQTLRDSIYF